ncbi:hypothetical protein EAI_12012 [Harpegnathos saltator]|uniref:Uncharacterized protein n=1 Tax=Harpegnathos saltator TaxID=610380 RepID=E2B6W7_HARSA|nr:hypothetical protein EAI_12012 [Harpegnathos saltator]
MVSSSSEEGVKTLSPLLGPSPAKVQRTRRKRYTKKMRVIAVLRPGGGTQLDACFRKLRRTRKSAEQIKDRNDPFVWRRRTSVVFYLGQGTESFYLG